MSSVQTFNVSDLSVEQLVALVSAGLLQPAPDSQPTNQPAGDAPAPGGSVSADHDQKLSPTAVGSCGDNGGRTRQGKPCSRRVGLFANGRCVAHQPKAGQVESVQPKADDPAPDVPEGNATAPANALPVGKLSEWLAVNARPGHEVTVSIKLADTEGVKGKSFARRATRLVNSALWSGKAAGLLVKDKQRRNGVKAVTYTPAEGKAFNVHKANSVTTYGSEAAKFSHIRRYQAHVDGNVATIRIVVC